MTPASSTSQPAVDGPDEGGPDLRTWLARLARDHKDWLVRVSRPVSTQGEISAVVKALEPHGAPAVMFEDVDDGHMPVVSGLFGGRERIAAAVNQPVDSLVEWVLGLDGASLPKTSNVAEPPVQQVVKIDDQARLDVLPIGLHSEQDAGDYITVGVVVARDPDSGAINTGIYRIMVVDDRHLTINAAPDHDLGRIIAHAGARGVSVPVAIVVGHHPAYAIASQLKNPVTVDNHQLCGALLGSSLRTTGAESVDIEVPADAEIVIEGSIEPDERVSEGPFGEFSYHYGRAVAPTFTVSAITHRRDAIYHDLHPTHVEHRALWLYPGREARLLEAVRTVVPGTRAVRIPFHGGGFSANIQVEKRRQGDGKQAILAAFARDHFLKHVYAVDADVDIFSDQDVAWATNVFFQASEDLVAIDRAKGIRMDPSAHRIGGPTSNDVVTDKLGFDCTRPLGEDFPERADRPTRGFASVDLADYLNEDDQNRLLAHLL